MITKKKHEKKELLVFDDVRTEYIQSEHQQIHIIVFKRHNTEDYIFEYLTHLYELYTHLIIYSTVTRVAIAQTKKPKHSRLAHEA